MGFLHDYNYFYCTMSFFISKCFYISLSPVFTFSYAFLPRYTNNVGGASGSASLLLVSRQEVAEFNIIIFIIIKIIIN